MEIENNFDLNDNKKEKNGPEVEYQQAEDYTNPEDIQS
jgi:hypothetical protein